MPSTGPRYATSTVLPSDERYSATDPPCFSIAVVDLARSRQRPGWATHNARHAVEDLEALAVALHQLAAALVVRGEHGAAHDEIRAGAIALAA